MPEPISTRTFIIKGTNKQITINSEKPGYVDAVLGRFVNGTITEKEARELKKAAAGGGRNSFLIEACELPNKLQKPAEYGYYDKYDIIIRDNTANYYTARVRDGYGVEPRGARVRNDFNLPSGHLFDYNEELFNGKKPFSHSGNWADNVDFKEGETFDFDIESTKFNEDGPAGKFMTFLF